MNKPILALALSTILLLFTTSYFFKENTLGISKYPTRFELENCVAEACFDEDWTCQADPSCVAQASQISSEYLSDPSNFQSIINSITNQNLINTHECEQQQCGILNYLTHCNQADAYFQNCVLETSGPCQAENPEHFQFFNNCTTKVYPTCSGLATDSEAYNQCFAEQFNFCTEEGAYLAKGKLALAFLCV